MFESKQLHLEKIHTSDNELCLPKDKLEAYRHIMLGGGGGGVVFVRSAH